MTSPIEQAARVAEMRKLADDLRPFAEKPLGSVRICVTEARKIVDAIDYALSDAGMLVGGWRPIESAPKGKTALIFIPQADQPANLPVGSTHVAYQTDQPEGFMNTWRYASGPGQGTQCGWPTHWLPLPAAPQSTGGGE